MNEGARKEKTLRFQFPEQPSPPTCSNWLASTGAISLPCWSSDIKLFQVAGLHCQFQMMIIADQEMLWAHSGQGKLWHNNVRETNWIHQTFCTDTNMYWCSSFFLLVNPIPKGTDITHTHTHSRPQRAAENFTPYFADFHCCSSLLLVCCFTMYTTSWLKESSGREDNTKPWRRVGRRIQWRFEECIQTIPEGE